MSDYIIKRNEYYYYFRRVPKDLAEYDSRKHIKISLKTKDKDTARKRAIFQNDTIEKFWRDIVTNPENTEQHGKLYRKAVKAARIHGFAYRDITDITENAGIGELVDRMLAMQSAQTKQTENKKVSTNLGASQSKVTPDI